MKKYLLVAFLVSYSAGSHALTVGEVMGALEEKDPVKKEMALQFWSGALEMALTINSHLSESGRPLFCLPKPWPNRKVFLDHFVQDVQALTKERGLEKTAALSAVQITLRSLASRYRKCS